MRIAQDLGNVRIVHDGSPFDVAHDIRVEWLVADQWQLFQGFNSLSNDYAFSESREAAARAVKKLAAQTAGAA